MSIFWVFSTAQTAEVAQNTLHGLHKMAQAQSGVILTDTRWADVVTCAEGFSITSPEHPLFAQFYATTFDAHPAFIAQGLGLDPAAINWAALGVVGDPNVPIRKTGAELVAISFQMLGLVYTPLDAITVPEPVMP